MNNYIISETITINEDIRLFLLPVSENIDHCNHSIIPEEQLNDVNGYKIKYDANKRLLARSFLYEYLSHHFAITNFELGYNDYKKPFLKEAPGIHFSFSYAKGHLLVGISRGREIGVDIEYIDPALNIAEITPEIMCSSELDQFYSYNNDPIRQRNYFFTLFSAKESIIKSFGTGLFFDVKEINILNNTAYSYKNRAFIHHDSGIWIDKYSMGLCYENLNHIGHR